jgi:hypothetical protein
MFLGIPESSLSESELANIDAAIAAMLSQLRLYTARYLTQATWLDTYLYNNARCRGRGPMILSEYPVWSIDSITLNPGMDNEQILDPAHYTVNRETGQLHVNTGYTTFEWWRWGYCSPGYNNSFSIQYTAGYDPLPADLLMLISDFARDRLNSFRSGASGGDAIQGEVSAIQIDGVGRVQYRSGVSRMTGGFDNKSAASGGPILGAGALIADLYRDIQKLVFPSTHIIVQNVTP